MSTNNLINSDVEIEEKINKDIEYTRLKLDDIEHSLLNIDSQKIIQIKAYNKIPEYKKSKIIICLCHWIIGIVFIIFDFLKSRFSIKDFFTDIISFITLVVVLTIVTLTLTLSYKIIMSFVNKKYIKIFDIEHKPNVMKREAIYNELKNNKLILNKKLDFYNEVKQFNNKSLLNNDYYRNAFIVRVPELKRLSTKLLKYSNSYTKNEILSYSERLFFKRLLSIASDLNCYVVPKTRLSDIINVNGILLKNYNHKWATKMVKYYFSFISQKHVDFVLINMSSNMVKLCIELDDPSHYDFNNKYFTVKKIKSDITKDVLLKYCNIPLLRIDSDNSDNDESLKEHIVQVINGTQVINYAYSPKTEELYQSSMEQLFTLMDKNSI